MLTSTFDPPKTLGEVTPQFLIDIHAEFPEQDTGTEWYRDEHGDKRPTNPHLMEALQPLNRLLLDRELGGTLGVRAIYYTVDTRTVQPGKSQRGLGSEWHRDRGSMKVAAAVVTDTNPTEFIIKRPGLINMGEFLCRSALSKQARPGRSFDISDSQIEEAGLIVYQPKPYEVALMRTQIHRSPTNHTDEYIPRTLDTSILTTAAQGLRN
jgi:hypothetical protein